MSARRLYEPNMSLHVMHRGNNRMNIFGDDSDCELFLSLLRRGAEKHGVHIHAYSLMANHYHLIVTPTHKDAVPATLQFVDGRYARYFNRRYDRIGTMWNGRPKEKGLHDRVYWLTCLRYVELNPVAASLVERAEAYRWSTYNAHAFGDGPAWLTSHRFYEELGDTPAARQATYRDMCKSLLTPAEVAFQAIA